MLLTLKKRTKIKRENNKDINKRMSLDYFSYVSNKKKSSKNQNI